MKLCGALEPAENFSDLVNQKGLDAIAQQTERANREGGEVLEQLLATIKSMGDVGFPSSLWISDHIPVGAVFSISKAESKI